jgi:hypothetical protein
MVEIRETEREGNEGIMVVEFGDYYVTRVCRRLKRRRARVNMYSKMSD